MSSAPGRSLHRLRALLAKEFRQVFRDPRMRFFVVVPPLLQLIIFGYAATFDVRHAELGVLDLSRTQDSRGATAAIAATGHYSLHELADMREARRAIDLGVIQVLVKFGDRFARDRTVQLIADGSDSNSAVMIVSELGRVLQRDAGLRSAWTPPVRIEERAWFNPTLEDRAYFIPGIMANVVLITTLMLAAMTVVRERELGTLERLLVTPVGRLEFLLAKIVPIACIGLADVAMISAIAIAWFDVPFHGSWVALLLGSALFLGSSLGLGLLISSYSRSQQQAVLMAFFMVMPMVILSGFAFPIENMPRPIQWLTWLDPLRYFLVVVRDVFLKGGGVLDHREEYASMLLLAALALWLSLRRLGRSE